MNGAVAQEKNQGNGLISQEIKQPARHTEKMDKPRDEWFSWM